MNKNKQAYDRPTTELFVVRFEGALLQASYGDQGKAGTLGAGNVYSFGDDED